MASLLVSNLQKEQHFERFRNRKIYYNSIEDYLKVSKTARFGCDMLKNDVKWEKI